MPRRLRQTGGVSSYRSNLLGEFVRRTYEQRGMSIRSLADASGLGRNVVERLLRGERKSPLTQRQMDGLAHALGVETSFLMQLNLADTDRAFYEQSLDDDTTAFVTELGAVSEADRQVAIAAGRAALAALKHR